MTDNLDKASRDRGNGESDEQESIDVELWRMWTAEIKPNFKAEEEFLQKHGRKLGYTDEYMDQISRDHRKMGELIWEGGEENVRKFSQLLANYIRFKQESFRAQFEKTLESQESEPNPEPGDGSPA